MHVTNTDVDYVHLGFGRLRPSGVYCPKLSFGCLTPMFIDDVTYFIHVQLSVYCDMATSPANSTGWQCFLSYLSEYTCSKYLHAIRFCFRDISKNEERVVIAVY